MPIFRFFFRLFTRKKYRKSYRKSYKEVLRTLPGLIAYYPLGDVEETDVRDSSGNDYHATLMGEHDAR